MTYDRTYALNGGSHGARGSAGVAHGSTVEVRGDEAGSDWCGFSLSLARWDSDSFWAA